MFWLPLFPSRVNPKFISYAFLESRHTLRISVAGAPIGETEGRRLVRG